MAESMFNPDLSTLFDDEGLAPTQGVPMTAGDQQLLDDQRLGAVNRIADMHAKSPGMFDYKPQQTNVGVLEAAHLGFSNVGIITGGTKALMDTGMDWTGVDQSLDRTFSVRDWSQSDELGQMSWNDMTAHNDPVALHYFNMLKSAPNARAASHIAATYMEKRNDLKKIEDAALFPFIVGALGSLVVDGGAMALTGGAAGAGIVGRMSQLIRFSKTAQGASMKAAAKVGTIGGMEGGIEAYMQSLTNKNMTLNDIILASGLGVAAGGLLGAAAPKFIGRVVSKESIENSRRVMTELEAANKAARGIAEGDAAGAARAVDDEMSIMDNTQFAKGAGSAVIGKVLPWQIRSPRRVAVDWAIRGAAKLREHGLVGSDRFGAIMQRVYQNSVFTDANIQGIAQKETIAMGMRLRAQELFNHTDEIYGMYGEFRKNVLKAPWWRSAVSNDYLLSGANKMTGKQVEGIPSMQDIRLAADDYAQAKFEGDTKAMKEIVAEFEGKIEPEGMQQLEGLIARVAEKDNAWYQKMGQEEVDWGIIPAEEFDPAKPYRPQSWDTEAITANMLQFKGQLLDRFGETPDADWVNTNYKDPAQGTGEGGVQLPADPVMAAGEGWEAFAKRRPGLAARVLDEWDEARKDMQADRLAEAEAELNKEMEKFVGETARNVQARTGKVIQTINKQINRAREKLDEQMALMRETGQSTTLIDELNTKIGRLELEAQAQRDLITDLQRAQDNFSRQKELVQTAGRRNVSRAVKQELKQLEKDLATVQRKAAKNEARKLISDRVNDTVRTMTHGMAPGGFLPEGAIETSKHFKRRTIDLSGVRHKPEWKQFLRKDSELNMDMYNDSVGRQLEIRAKFNPVLAHLGRLPDDVSPHSFKPVDEMKKYMSEGYEADEVKLREKHRLGQLDNKGFTKELKLLKKRQKQEEYFFDRVFGEVTRSDYLGDLSDAGKTLTAQMISTLQATTAATALGHIMASQLTDVAITAFAGGRGGTGFKAMFRRIVRRGIIKDIVADQPTMRAFLRGGNVASQGMYISRLDIGDGQFDIPGGMMGKIQRTATSVAVVEGWANGMHVWNRFVRSSFGIDFARQVGNDILDYDNLSPSLKSFYAKHGIGETDIKDMAEMFTKHSVDVDGIRVPDFKKWSEAGQDRLVRKYKRAMTGAGDEAMLDPGIGDRPFLRRSPMGRLLLQFSSFTYKAGTEWFAPMIQNFRLHPGDVRNYFAAALGLVLAAAAGLVRSYAVGKWDDNNAIKAMDGDGQAFFDSVKESYMRSPYAFGLSGVTMDLLGTYGAKPGNQLWNAAGGPGKLFNDKWTKLKQGQGVAGALGGPALGMVSSIGKTASKAAEGGDVGDDVMRKLPVVNSLMLHLALQSFNSSYALGAE